MYPAKSNTIYLACPYNHSSSEVRAGRYTLVTKVAANLISRGHTVFSPITHSHPIAEHGLPGGWDYWQTFDRIILSVCGKLWVLKLDGWDRSEGVREEIKTAEEMRLEIRYLELEEVLRG